MESTSFLSQDDLKSPLSKDDPNSSFFSRSRTKIIVMFSRDSALLNRGEGCLQRAIEKLRGAEDDIPPGQCQDLIHSYNILDAELKRFTDLLSRVGKKGQQSVRKEILRNRLVIFYVEAYSFERLCLRTSREGIAAGLESRTSLRLNSTSSSSSESDSSTAASPQPMILHGELDCGNMNFDINAESYPEPLVLTGKNAESPLATGTRTLDTDGLSVTEDFTERQSWDIIRRLRWFDPDT